MDRPEVMSSVFLAASSLIRNNCTRASIELSCPPWLSLSWLSRPGEVRNCTREATFCLLSSTKLIKSSKLWLRNQTKWNRQINKKERERKQVGRLKKSVLDQKKRNPSFLMNVSTWHVPKLKFTLNYILNSWKNVEIGIFSNCVANWEHNHQ